MAQLKDSPIAARVREALVDQPGFLRDILQATLQRLLEEEITLHLNAVPHERTEVNRPVFSGGLNASIAYTLSFTAVVPK